MAHIRRLFFLHIVIFVHHVSSVELELYMADPEVRIAQKIYCQISGQSSTDRLKAWYDNNEVFSKDGDLQSEEVFTVSYRNQLAGTHSLKVSILNQSGNQLVSKEHQWKTLHNGVPEVGIDEHNALIVNGEYHFPLFGQIDEKIEQWKEHGLGNTACANYWDTAYSVSDLKTWLDFCVHIGVRSIGPYSRWSGITEKPHGLGNDTTIMGNYVRTYRDHPGNLIWLWADEPDGGETVSPKEIRSWTEVCHRNDTDHPHFVNQIAYYWGKLDESYPNNLWYRQHCKKYSYVYGADQHGGERKLLADIVGFDFYPIEYSNCEPVNATFASMCAALDSIRAWNHNLCPIFSWIENCDIHPDFDNDGLAEGPFTYDWTPPPSSEQLWSEYWLKTIHGVRGFQVHAAFDKDCRGFDDTADKPRNYSTLKKFGSYINDLKDVIMGPDIKRTITNNASDPGKRVDHMAKISNDTLYIFAARLTEVSETSPANISVQFTCENVTSNKVYLYDSDDSLSLTAGVFTATFSPYEVKIFKVPHVKAAIKNFTRNNKLEIKANIKAELFTITGRRVNIRHITNRQQPSLSRGVYLYHYQSLFHRNIFDKKLILK